LGDPYLDENGVLKNKLGIEDQAELSALEARLAAARELQILASPPEGPFDLLKLEKIHGAIFGDVYTWAGKLRVTTLAKRAYEGSNEGITSFTQPLRIAAEARALLRDLPQIESLSALSAKDFAQTIAPYFVKLNNIHPFREGNGRTQRLFFSLLSRSCGHELSWDVVTRERMVAVSIAGARGDDTAMIRMFGEVSNERRVGALRKGLRFLQQANDFAWNDLYIATTTAGQSYSGRLVGRAGSDFMMRVEGGPETWVAIGDAEDLSNEISSGDDFEVKPRNW
jgi:cell filamentation protein